jgi:hypothetical protein
MENIKTLSELRSAIKHLEEKKAEEWTLLKDEFQSSLEAVKPVNILKSAFKELTSTPDFKEDIIGATMGTAAGFLSKALIGGVSNKPIIKIVGSILQVAISKIVEKNSGFLISTTGKIASFFGKKKDIADPNENLI